MNDWRPSTLLLLLTTGACFNPDPSAPLDTEGASTTTTATDPTATMTMTTTTTDPTTTGVDSSTSVSSADSEGDTTTTTSPGESSTTDAEEQELEISINGRVVPSGHRHDILEQVDVGMTGSAVEVVVENVGGQDLEVGGVVVFAPGDTHFAVDQDSLAVTLGPGEQSSFSVALSPQNGGRKEVSMALGTNDADENPFELSFGGHSTGNRFFNVQPMNAPSPRFNAAMTYVGNGQIILFGGRESSGVRVSDTWRYDVDEGNWTPLNPPTSPSERDAHAMTYVGDDRVVMFGGSQQMGPNVGLDDTWIYDVAANNWSLLPTPISPQSRYQHSMASIADGALLYGGRQEVTMFFDVWRFNAAANAWINQGPPGPPQGSHAGAMAWDGDDTMVVFGGFEVNTPLDVTSRYSLSTNSWSPGTSAGGPGTRGALSGEFFANGQFIVHSGKALTCCNDPDPGTFGYDPVTDSWMDMMPPGEPIPRYNYSMAYVQGSNKAIIFGGQFQNGGPGSATAETWEYVGPVPMP